MSDLLKCEDKQWLQGIWDKLYAKMKSQCERLGTDIPYIPVDGAYHDLEGHTIAWWTNGFWPGMLWQMYQATGESGFREAAAGVEQRLAKMFDEFIKMDHDTGFLWLHSAVADYRLTGNHQSYIYGLHAANILAGRYNPSGGFIRAWGSEAKDSRYGWMIIDCLMNMPLLYWASKETGDPRFYQMAVNHTNTTMKYLLRQDGSAYHIAVLDAITGDLESYPDGQGYAPDSAWSRGQAWAVYGMSLAYKYTGRKEYLVRAKQCAHYLIANLMLTSYVPLADFRAPETPVLYDTSAGSCAVCGLLELSELVNNRERKLYRKAALNTLKALTEKHCNWRPEEDSILAQGCVAYHSEKERDVPLIYGDYFLVEAVTRLMGKGFAIW